ALGADAPPVGLDDLAADVEPEAEPASRLVVDLPEALEHVRQRRRVDAPTAVVHDELDLLTAPRHMKVDRALGGGELHGVTEQVREHLHDAIVIERCDEGRNRNLDVELPPSSREQGLI